MIGQILVLGVARRDAKPGPSEPAKDKPASKEARPKITGAQILKLADKNGDGVLTKDEFSEKDRKDFDKADQDKNGKVDGECRFLGLYTSSTTTPRR